MVVIREALSGLIALAYLLWFSNVLEESFQAHVPTGILNLVLTHKGIQSEKK